MLRALRVLDTPSEPGFDRLTRLAQHIMGVPIALVSLIDADRQWFKSKQGLEAPQTPRSVSFCGHAINAPQTFVIPDAHADPRFADNPLVLSPPHVRFYAGAPLTVDGMRVGTLCAIDHVARQPTPSQLQALRDLADCVEQELQQAALHRAALRLRDHEARLQAVLDNVADGILTIDDKGKIQSVNPAITALFGYQPEELLGGSMRKLMTGRDAELGRWLSGQGDQRRWVGQLTGQKKDGDRFELEVAASGREEGGGRTFTAVLRDVSERNRTQRELNQFKDTLDQARDCIFMFWPDTLQFFYVNLGATQQVGYSVDELLGMTPLQLKPDFTEESYREKLKPLLEGKGRSLTFETVHRHKDGRLLNVETFVQYVSPKGEAPRFINIVRDISERRLAEKRLREVTVHLQAILDSANFSVISTDADGLIRTFNRGAEAMLGYRADELVAKETPGVLHDGQEVVARAAQLTEELGVQVEPGFEAFVAHARLGEADEREWTYVRKDGSRLPVLLSVTAMRDEAGELFGFLGVAVDLTERKKVDQLKSEFISTVSHELRTPLTSIRGGLGLVLGKFHKDLPPRALTLLETANRNAERLTLLINDILDLEKLESGRLEFEFKPVDLVLITRQALASLESYARQYEVTLKLLDAPPTAIVSGDEHRLTQVFANLVSNAVKYSPAGGEVTLRIERSGGDYVVRVRDTGRGIPERFRARVFERFAQADGSDTRKQGGTGLGLSITRAIVQRHQGHIDFTSEEGKGSEFFFTVPSLEAAMKEAPVSAQPLLLVCEDNGDVAEVLAQLLAGEGLACDIAGSAAAARALLQKKTYRGILLDLGLPDADGLDLVHELRAAPGLERLPIIVVSGRADDGRASWKGDALGLLDWVQKPVDPTRLALALQAALSSPTGRPRVLHVEDDLDVVQITRSLLEDVAEVDFAASLASAAEHLSARRYDVVLLDLTLPDGSGLELLDRIVSPTRVVVFSGQEPSAEISRSVAATLIKSRTTNQDLLESITRLLKKEPAP